MDFFRKMIVASNWKMNTNIPEGQKLLEEIMAGLPSELPCQVIISPSVHPPPNGDQEYR